MRRCRAPELHKGARRSPMAACHLTSGSSRLWEKRGKKGWAVSDTESPHSNQGKEVLNFSFYRPGNRDSGSFSHLLGVIQLEGGTAEIQTQDWLAPVPKLYLGIKQGLPAPSHLGRKGETVLFTGKGLQALTQSSPSQAWQPKLHGVAVPTTRPRLKRSQPSSPAPAPVSTQDRGLS